MPGRADLVLSGGGAAGSELTGAEFKNIALADWDWESYLERFRPPRQIP